MNTAKLTSSEKLRKFAISGDRHWTPFFAGREGVIKYIEAACERVGNCDLDEYSAWNSRAGVTCVIQGAHGAGKTSLLAHIKKNWLKRSTAGDPAPVSVNIPVFAIESPAALAQAIENGLPRSLADRSKGLLNSIKSLSVMGTGLSFDRSRSNSPENLQFPQNRVVVLMIDEAQNLDLSSARTPEAKLLQWLHQGNHGLPLLPVLAGLAHLDSRLECAGISRLSIDSVHSLGCLSRQETLQSATLFFDHFGIPRSEARSDWTDTLYSLSEGWPIHLHHGFRVLAARVADAELMLEAVDSNAFRREEAKLRSNYYDERTNTLPVQLAARMLVGVGPSGTREDYADAIDAEHEARRGGRAFQIPDGLNADDLFDRMVANGLLKRVEFGVYCVPIPSLKSFVTARSGSNLHLFAQSGKAEGVKRALAQGKDPNGVDITGRTPLHIAAECGWTEIVKTLLEAGANTETADGRGRFPRELLPSYSSAELKEILIPEYIPSPLASRREPGPEDQKCDDDPAFEM
ncbi:MAG: ankyrin repeat domain-containing protein [Albidovulum sp.]|nr:ankyrin repeat domain-containing protein [Albidovulum sp.]